MKRVVLFLIFFIPQIIRAESYMKVLIIGTGTETDHYRPDLTPGTAFNAIIPMKTVNGEGVPLRTDCIVEIPDADVVKVDARKVLATYTEMQVKIELFSRGDSEFIKLKGK